MTKSGRPNRRAQAYTRRVNAGAKRAITASNERSEIMNKLGEICKRLDALENKKTPKTKKIKKTKKKSELSRAYYPTAEDRELRENVNSGLVRYY